MYRASSRHRDRQSPPPALLEILESRNLLSTTLFGTPGSYQNAGADYTKAFDGNPATYFDAPVPQAYAGIDYGSPVTLNSVTFYPRPGLGWRMVGGTFQGSNDNAAWTNLTPAIPSTPPDNTPTILNANYIGQFRYLRYLSPDGGFGNVAEVTFNLQPNPTAPAAPTHLTSSHISQYTTVDLSYQWDRESAGYFEAQLSTTPDFSTLVATESPTTNSVRFTDLPAGTYYFRVRAVNYTVGASDFTAADPVTVSPLPPAATNLAYTVNPDNSLTFTWTDNATDESGYLVGLTTSPASDYPDTALPANATTVTLATNPAYSTYVFHVRPTSPDGVPPDATITATIISTQTPAAPGFVRAAATAPDAIAYSWSNNAHNAIAEQWQLSASPDFSAIARAGTLDATDYASTVTVTSLPVGTYYFRVRAANAAGVSDYVNAPPITLVATSSAQLTGVPIGTPGSWGNHGDDISNAFDNDVTTFFDGPDSISAVGLDLGAPNVISSVRYYPRARLAYRMFGGSFQGSNDNANWTTLATISAQPLEGQYNVVPVNNPTAFRYVRFVSAESGYGNVAELQFFGAGAPTPFIPAPPTNPTVTSAADSLNFAWTNNAINQTGFTLQLSTSPDFTSPTTSTLTLPADATNHTYPDLTLGTTYYFRVAATNATGSSPFATYGPLTFTGAPTTPLTGTPSGTPGSFANSGATFDKVFDNDPNTFFDAPTAQAYVELALPAPAILSSVSFYPRANLAVRMVGGLFQGSNDDATWTTLATISAQPPQNQFTSLPVSNPTPFRYLRYVAPANGYGNVAELQFLGTPFTSTNPNPSLLTGTPIGTPGSWNNSGNDLTKALDDNPDTFFDAPTSQAYVGLDLGSPTSLASVSFFPRAGLAWRMTGGLFQGSDDNSIWTTLATISTQPADGQYTSLPIIDTTPYRYVRYLSPANGFGNVAELQWFGTITP